VSDPGFDWSRVAAGDAVAPLVLDITPTRVVAGAIASRDFMPVHHDKAFANAQGAPDIFMNILSLNGYCSRFLTDWAGPDAMLRRLAVRLGLPVVPGLTLTFAGTVDEVVDGRVTVSFAATSSMGVHLDGTAALSRLV
jgi:acyl dehydratase